MRTVPTEADLNRLLKQRTGYKVTASGKYNYENFWTEAPHDHRIVGELAARGNPLDVIIDLTGLGKQCVRNILQHPPVRQYLAWIKMQVDEKRRELHKEREEMAEAAFKYQRGVIKGATKPNSVRMQAAFKAMDYDPQNRFALPSANDGLSTPQTTATLQEFVERSRRTLLPNEVTIKDTQDDEHLGQSDDATEEHGESGGTAGTD